MSLTNDDWISDWLTLSVRLIEIFGSIPPYCASLLCSGGVFPARWKRHFVHDASWIGSGRAAAFDRRQRWREQRRRPSQRLCPGFPQRGLHHETVCRCRSTSLPDAALAGTTRVIWTNDQNINSIFKKNHVRFFALHSMRWFNFRLIGILIDWLIDW